VLVRHTRRMALIGGAATLTAIVFGLAATWRPRWYRPPVSDPDQARADKAAIVRLQDQISAALNAGRPIRVRLAVDQVNRWLAMPDALWSGTRLLPPAWQHPCLRIDGSVLTLGITARAGDWGVVLSLTCALSVTPDWLVIRTTCANVGAIPVPISWLSLPAELRARVERSGGTWEAGTIRLPSEWVWPNGKRRFRVGECYLVADSLEVLLEP